MAKTTLAGLAAAAILLSGCVSTALASTETLASGDANTIGDALDITYRVTANRGDGGCKLPGNETPTEGACYEASIELSSPRKLDLTGARIYFSQIELVDRVAEMDGGRIEHVNGDLHVLSLDPEAATIAPGETRKIRFIVKGMALSRAKFMPNYYVVDGKGTIAPIASTQEQDAEAMGRRRLPFLAPLPGDLRRGNIDLTPLETAQVTFEQNAQVAFDRDAVDSGIVPRPARVAVSGTSDRLDISQGFRPVIAGTANGFQAAIARLDSLGFRQSPDGVNLTIKVDPELPIEAEGYHLSTGSDGIAVEASDEAGAFYALQTIGSLIRPGQRDIPALTIEDAPRFAFRGMQIDIARNFFGADVIRALIDQMAAYKLNKLHLHLADDEGWRLEIAGLPELTEVGARRCHDLLEDRCLLPQLGSGPAAEGAGSGHLSATEYVALVRYAQERHVEIIPALDMPGHARAAVKAMEARYRRLIAEGASEEEASRFLLSDPDDRTVYSSVQHYSDNTINVCRPSTYRFVDHVLDRLIALHDAAGVPLRRYHIGADETAGAWSDSPLCSEFLERSDTPAEAHELGAYFVARVARMIAERGLIAGAWSDGLSHADARALPEMVQSNIWSTFAAGGAAIAHDHANRGWEVVLSFPDALYFDFPQASHPEEGGYYWGARRAPARKLFSLMPENLLAMAAYWKDRDEQPFTAEAPPLEAGRGFVGIQGQIWTETVRDRATLGYQIFPRMFALSERAWHRPDWEIAATSSHSSVSFGDERVTSETLDAIQRDWNRFSSIVAAKELPKLEDAGWSYRLPVPGAHISEKGLEVNTSIPGLTVECRTETGWVPAAQCSDRTAGPVELRVTGADGRRHSRVVVAER